jgi:hypothetical protein
MVPAQTSGVESLGIKWRAKHRAVSIAVAVAIALSVLPRPARAQLGLARVVEGAAEIAQVIRTNPGLLLNTPYRYIPVGNFLISHGTFWISEPLWRESRGALTAVSGPGLVQILMRERILEYLGRNGEHLPQSVALAFVASLDPWIQLSLGRRLEVGGFHISQLRETNEAYMVSQLEHDPNPGARVHLLVDGGNLPAVPQRDLVVLSTLTAPGSRESPSAKATVIKMLHELSNETWLALFQIFGTKTTQARALIDPAELKGLLQGIRSNVEKREMLVNTINALRLHLSTITDHGRGGLHFREGIEIRPEEFARIQSLTKFLRQAARTTGLERMTQGEGEDFMRLGLGDRSIGRRDAEEMRAEGARQALPRISMLFLEDIEFVAANGVHR